MSEQKETNCCRICGITMEIELFEVDSRVKGGKTTRCKACKYKTQDKAVRAYQKLHERAAKTGSEVEATLDEIKKLYAMFDGLCIYCGAEEQQDGPTFHLDHVRPISEGGTHHISNLVIACPSCNLRKHAKPVVTHYYNSEEFKSEHLAVLAHYVAFTSGQPVEEVVRSFTDDYAEYEINRIKD